MGYVTSEYDDLDYSVLPDDVLLSHINSVRHIGKVARKQDERPLIHGMNLIRLRFNRRIHPSYGFALLNWSQTKAYFERRAKKAVNQASINQQDIQELPLSLPLLPEQRAIAAVLDSIDDAIERTEAVIAATEQLRDSLLHQLLTRGVPGWHTEWKDVPGLGTIPADWEVVRLGGVIESATYGTNAQLGSQGAVAILRMNNLQDGEIDLSGVRHATLSDKESAGLSLTTGDILFNRTNSLDLVGKVAIVRDLPYPMSFASYLVRLRAKETLADPFWLSTLLWSESYQSRIRRFATPGVSQANINPTSLKSLAISLPPLGEQRTIARVLDGVDATVAESKRERDGLRLLKDSTADAILSGRVRVGQIS